ncbi:MAG: hypothetical protein H6587_08250 [Flavobacteriales bacterium]|nr:hypothetical protein [Flavobacteriales bacterium]MCB9364545.1 hypothetical protein [Flavobacteriales bacterium]
MTDFIYWLGDISYAFFGVFEKLENLPNYIFIVLGFVGLLYWLNLQKKYNKKAQETGALK